MGADEFRPTDLQRASLRRLRGDPERILAEQEARDQEAWKQMREERRLQDLAADARLAKEREKETKQDELLELQLKRERAAGTQLAQHTRSCVPPERPTKSESNFHPIAAS